MVSLICAWPTKTAEEGYPSLFCKRSRTDFRRHTETGDSAICHMSHVTRHNLRRVHIVRLLLLYVNCSCCSALRVADQGVYRAQLQLMVDIGFRGATAAAFAMNEDFSRTLENQMDIFNSPDGDQVLV